MGTKRKVSHLFRLGLLRSSRPKPDDLKWKVGVAKWCKSSAYLIGFL